MEARTKTTNWYIQTSADDCKISLCYCTADDLPLLRECLTLAEADKKKTHAKHITSRIRQLKKEVV